MLRKTWLWAFLAFSLLLKPGLGSAYVSSGGDWELIRSVHGEIGGDLTGSDYKVTHSMGEPFIALSALTGGAAASFAGYLSQVPSFSNAGTSITVAGGSSTTVTLDGIVYGIKPGDSVVVSFNNEMTSTTLPGAVTVTAILDNLGNAVSAGQAYTLTYSATEQAAYVSLGAGWPKGTLFLLTISTHAEEINGSRLVNFSTVNFATARDFAAANVVFALGDPSTKVEIPARAFPSDYSVAVSTGVRSQTITTADETMAANLGAASRPFKKVQIDAFGPTMERWSANLNAQASIIIPFDDLNSDGRVDDTSPAIRSKTVWMWRLDEGAKLWVRQPRSSLDLANKRVVLPADHFSTYALAGSADTDVSLSYAFPVPFRPSGGNPARYGTWADGIRFTNLPSTGRIRIFTISGELVRELEVVDNPQRWDVKNQVNEVVASGVYIWEVTSGQNRKSGKLMVVK
ncbi:MAG: T9SS type A sorting domain-containing protein [Elusimicrobia bacterium]|nr:T9SS type A sorting domain-containing protein [Elusimicrobiota bacterium]